MLSSLPDGTALLRYLQFNVCLQAKCRTVKSVYYLCFILVSASVALCLWTMASSAGSVAAALTQSEPYGESDAKCASKVVAEKFAYAGTGRRRRGRRDRFGASAAGSVINGSAVVRAASYGAGPRTTRSHSIFSKHNYISFLFDVIICRSPPVGRYMFRQSVSHCAVFCGG